MSQNQKLMAVSKRKSQQPQQHPVEALEVDATEEFSQPPAPTGKIFLGEEDKRLLKKFNEHIVNKLGLGGNRSFKI